MAALLRLCLVLNYLLVVINGFVLKAPVNLIKNGGFESGKLAPWTYEPVYSRNKAGYEIVQPALTEGKYAFVYSAHTRYDPGAEGRDAGFVISQHIPTVVGANYSLRLDFLGRSTGEEKGESLYIQAGNQTFHIYTIKAGQIVHFKRTFKPTTTSSVVSLAFYSDPYYSYDNTQFTELDNIRVFKQ